ncbi:MAG: glycosyltransferase [Gemmatimonadetes bacterium]|nr:glycosyltransferase [Gemmatimonadota bacterium]
MDSSLIELSLAGFTAVYAAGVLWFRQGLANCGEDNRNREKTHLPERRISIVIAARNEEDHIASCLRGLARQTLPAEWFEVILVDDGSSDGTAKIAKEFARGTGLRLTILRTDGITGGPGSKKRALSLGVEKAEGEVVLTTDADCRLPPTWAASMARRFDDDAVGMVIGYAGIRRDSGRLGLLGGWEAVDFLNLMAAAAAGAGRGRALAASGQSLGFRKAAFDEVGGYSRIMHRGSGDDVLLMQLIRRTRRWRILFAGDAAGHVVHPPSSSLSGLLAKRSRWASNAPFQALLDPPFFAYLACTFAMSAMLLAAPVLAWWGAASWFSVAAAWLAKSAAEGALFARSRQVFQRPDLHWQFLPWTLSQPLCIVAAGLFGALGRFDWKGRSYRWGVEVGGTSSIPGAGPAGRDLSVIDHRATVSR